MTLRNSSTFQGTLCGANAGRRETVSNDLHFWIFQSTDCIWQPPFLTLDRGRLSRAFWQTMFEKFPNWSNCKCHIRAKSSPIANASELLPRCSPSLTHKFHLPFLNLCYLLTATKLISLPDLISFAGQAQTKRGKCSKERAQTIKWTKRLRMPANPLLFEIPPEFLTPPNLKYCTAPFLSWSWQTYAFHRLSMQKRRATENPFADCSDIWDAISFPTWTATASPLVALNRPKSLGS